MQLTIRICAHDIMFVQTEADGKISAEPFNAKTGVSVAANMRQAFAESRMLAEGHRCARALVDSPVLLVPSEEYDGDGGKVAQLYSYTFGLDRSCEVRVVEMDEENVVAAFSVNRDLMLVLNDNFREVRFLPLVQPVWKALHRDSYNTASRRMYAWLHGRQMELVAFRQNRIAFSNRFDAAHAADAAYFLLNVWKQLGMKNGDDELCVIGDCLEKDKFLPMVREYVAHVSRTVASDLFGDDWAARTAELPLDLQALFFM